MLSKFFSAFQKYRQQRFESYPTDIFDEGEGVSKHRLVIFWAPLALRPRQTSYGKITRKNAWKCALFPNLFSFEFQRIFTRFFPEKNDKSRVFQEKTRKKRVKI